MFHNSVRKTLGSNSVWDSQLAPRIIIVKREATLINQQTQPCWYIVFNILVLDECDVKRIELLLVKR